MRARTINNLIAFLDLLSRRNMFREPSGKTKELLEEIGASAAIKRGLRHALDTQVSTANAEVQPYRGVERLFDETRWSDTCTVEDAFQMAKPNRSLALNVLQTYVQSLMRKHDKAGLYTLLRARNLLKFDEEGKVITTTMANRLSIIRHWMVIVCIDSGDVVLHVYSQTNRGEMMVEVYDPSMPHRSEQAEYNKRSEVHLWAGTLVLSYLRNTKPLKKVLIREVRRQRTKYEGRYLLGYYARCVLRGRPAECTALDFNFPRWRVEMMVEVLLLDRANMGSSSNISKHLTDGDEEQTSYTKRVYDMMKEWIEKVIDSEEEEEVIEPSSPSGAAQATQAVTSSSEETSPAPKRQKISLLKKVTNLLSGDKKPRAKPAGESMDIKKLVDYHVVPPMICTRCRQELRGFGIVLSHMIDASCSQTKTCPKITLPLSRHHLAVMENLSIMAGAERIYGKGVNAPNYDEDLMAVAEEMLGFGFLEKTHLKKYIHAEKEFERQQRRRASEEEELTSAESIAQSVEKKAEYFSKHRPPTRRFHYPPSWEYPVYTWTRIKNSRWFTKFSSSTIRRQKSEQMDGLIDDINDWMQTREKPYQMAQAEEEEEEDEETKDHNDDDDSDDNDDHPGGDISSSQLFGSSADEGDDKEPKGGKDQPSGGAGTSASSSSES